MKSEAAAEGTKYGASVTNNERPHSGLSAKNTTRVRNRIRFRLRGRKTIKTKESLALAMA